MPELLRDLSREADAYIDEQERLLRALNDSLDREKEHIRQVHRVKDKLVASSLKLQVATKALENDDTTIKQLRRDLFEAQKVSHDAVSKQEIAADLIQALRLEVIQLNRRMKDQMSIEDTSHSIPQSAIYQEADNQVEKMMYSKGIRFNTASTTPMQTGTLEVCHEPRGDNRPTDFQEWKMKRFLWAPDTPGASENCDSDVVNELLHASMHPQDATGIFRNSKSSIAKKRLHSSKPSDEMKKSVKSLPSVKATSKNNKKLQRKSTMNDDEFLREFKNATKVGANDRPKTSQVF